MIHLLEQSALINEKVPGFQAAVTQDSKIAWYVHRRLDTMTPSSSSHFALGTYT